MEVLAVGAVLVTVALTTAAAAPAVLDGALRARVLTPRLGVAVVGAGAVLGALATGAGPLGGPARAVVTTLTVAGGAGGVLAATLALLLVAGALTVRAARGAARTTGPAGAGSRPRRLPVVPGTTVLLVVLVLVAAGTGASWRAAALLVVVPAAAAPAAAAAGTLVLLVAAAWVLRHATPEPVHRRARVLAVVSTALLAVGVGAQTGQVGLALVLLVTGDGAALVRPDAAVVPAWAGLLVAAAAGAGALTALLLPRALLLLPRRARPVPRREPLTVLVADSCAAAVLLGATVLALPVPALPVVLAARAGGDLLRGARAVEWRALAGR